MTQYSAEDFRFYEESPLIEDDLGYPACEVIRAALRIAARVMEPGMIEAAIARAHLDFEGSPFGQFASATIRAALTKDSTE